MALNLIHHLLFMVIYNLHQIIYSLNQITIGDMNMENILCQLPQPARRQQPTHLERDQLSRKKIEKD